MRVQTLEQLAAAVVFGVCLVWVYAALVML
jgi:hypothetical protein